MYVPFSVFRVLFVCKCVLYCCHRVSTQMQSNISYHKISYHVVSYHITSYQKHTMLLLYTVAGWNVSNLKCWRLYVQNKPLFLRFIHDIFEISDKMTGMYTYLIQGRTDGEDVPIASMRYNTKSTEQTIEKLRPPRLLKKSPTFYGTRIHYRVLNIPVWATSRTSNLTANSHHKEPPSNTVAEVWIVLWDSASRSPFVVVWKSTSFMNNY
jgi:hypothetical protein